MPLVMHMPWGLWEAAGAERRPQRQPELVMAPVGTQIAELDARMTWGAEVNGMVLCGSVKLSVCMGRVTELATAGGISHSR